MEKENYNQIIFTAVRDNILGGYFYTLKEVTQVENQKGRWQADGDSYQAESKDSYTWAEAGSY